MTDMNSEALRYLDHYTSLYEIVTSHHLTAKSDKQVLGKNTFQCRFCGNIKPNVTFKKKAHAIPEFIGNRALFSQWECDQCNSKFGRLLEANFANFMHLNHTLYGISGKNGNPVFKTGDGTRIETKDSLIDWQGVPDENIELDTANSSVQIKQKMPSFIPVAVFKTLVKMALTIIPETELKYFSNTIEWLLEDEHRTSRFLINDLWMYYGTFESADRCDQLSVVLAKKRQLDNQQLPYMLFNLNYGNFDFQLPIPLCTIDEDRIFNQSSITYLPHLTDFKHGFGKMALHAFNMYYKEQIVGKEMTFILTDISGNGTIAK
jgi:hypothetical protein